MVIGNLQGFIGFLGLTHPILTTVTGDCMEGRDICDGDIVEVDLAHMPSIKDACLCCSRDNVMMVKEYVGKFGPMQLVGTKYKQNGAWRQDRSLEPLAIFGVVGACYTADMQLKWRIDTSSHPTKLPTASTIKSGNVGAPTKAREAAHG